MDGGHGTNNVLYDNSIRQPWTYMRPEFLNPFSSDSSQSWGSTPNSGTFIPFPASLLHHETLITTTKHIHGFELGQSSVLFFAVVVKMIIYMNPAFYVFLAAFTAFILLLLTTVSIPLVSTFYFLKSSQANGVRFGMWGWCLDEGTCSSPLKLGYTWEPEITIPITSALVFYPITVILTFLTMVSLMPVLCARSKKSDKIFDIFAWVSLGSSALAFLFMMGMFSIAKSRFEKQGFTASYGNLPWMSLASMFLLLAVSVSPYFFVPPPKERTRRSRSHRHDLEARPSRRREISRRPVEQKA